MASKDRKFREFVLKRRFEEAGRLIDKGLVDIDAYVEGMTALHVAAANCADKATSWLCARRAYVDARKTIDPRDTDSVDAFGATPLMLAAAGVRPQAVATMKVLLSAGADTDAQDSKGETPLFHARGDLERIALLIEAGANVDLRNKDGVSPLMLAVLVNRSREAAMLRAAGANEVGVVSAQMAAIIDDEVPSRDEILQEVKRLLGEGADPNFRCDRTVLSCAAERGYDAVVDVLLGAGADPNRLESDSPHGDFGPLSRAVGNGHLGVVRRLLDAGADATVSNNGFSVLSYVKMGSSQQRKADAPWSEIGTILKAAIKKSKGDAKGQSIVELSPALTKLSKKLLDSLGDAVPTPELFRDFSGFKTVLLESDELGVAEAQEAWSKLTGPARAEGWSCFLVRKGFEDASYDTLQKAFKALNRKMLETWLKKTRKERLEEESEDWEEGDEDDITLKGHERRAAELEAATIEGLRKSESPFPNFRDTDGSGTRRLVFLQGPPGGGALLYGFGMDGGPDSVQVAQMLNRWHREHGAEVAEYGHNTLELYVKTPLSHEDLKANLRLFPLFVPDAESFEENLATLCSSWWWFWWD